MPIDFKMNRDEGYYEVTYSGPIPEADFFGGWHTFLESGELVPGYNMFVDLGEAQISVVSSKDIRTAAEYIRTQYRDRGLDSIKSAIYAPGDLQYGLARMFEVYAEQFGGKTQVFRDRDEAIAWLKER